MTDSESSLHQDESDEDIYKDFPVFNFEDELAKLEGSNKAYKQETIDLSEKVKILGEENEKLKKLNETLGKNLSTLLKTAQAEVKRKDAMIEELRSKVDSFTFRKNKTITKDQSTSTEDLKSLPDVHTETKDKKNDKEKKRAKSNDNRNSSDCEHRFVMDVENKSEGNDGRLRNIDCDKERRYGYRDSLNKHKFKNSHSYYDRYSERHRGSSFRSRESRSSHRKSFRYDRRSHLKYDSLDKKRHSRRSPRRRRSSRESKDSREDRKSKSKKSREKSCSHEKSFGSKDCILDKSKSQSSSSRNSSSKSKEQISNKLKKSDCVQVDVQNEKNDKQNENLTIVKKEKIVDQVKIKEKQTSFEMTSPLDDLYSEQFISRTSQRISNNNSSGSLQQESELEEGELEENLENWHQTEDWTLSFKNERKNDTKPLTLYSKRMIEKFSLESKPVENERLNEKANKKNQKEKILVNNCQPKVDNVILKEIEVDKEPGELTEDENVIESSKEFQEIAKVASIENSLNENPVETVTEGNAKDELFLFKEPVRRVSAGKIEKNKEQSLSTKIISESVFIKENVSKDSDEFKESREVIEFSPFKNNYKLIAISPIKPPDNKHVLDFYNIRLPSNAQTQKEVEASVLNLLSSLSGVPINSTKDSTCKMDATEKAPEIQKKEVCDDESNLKHEKKCEQKVKSKDRHNKNKIGEGNEKSLKSKKTKSSLIDEKEKVNYMGLRPKGQDSNTKSKNDSKTEKATTKLNLETPELFDFCFLTSPVKPNILDESNLESGVPIKNNHNLSEEKSEIDEKKSVTTAESSTEKDSLKNSSSEKESLKNSSSEKDSLKNSSSEKDFDDEKLALKVKNSKPNLRSKRGNSREVEREKSRKGKKIEKNKEKPQDTKRKSEKSQKKEEKGQEKNQNKSENQEDNLGRGKRRLASKKAKQESTRTETIKKRKRENSCDDEKDKGKSKKIKSEENVSPRRKTRSNKDMKTESSLAKELEEKPKEDISSFEFFKPITKEDNSKIEPEIGLPITSSVETKAMMSITEFVCLETPRKSVEKIKNIFINEQAILDSRNRSIFSPLISSKSIDMTPRRLLKNDLTLTDSEDDTITITTTTTTSKTCQEEEENNTKKEEEYSEEIEEDEGLEDEEEEEEEENSEDDSDSNSDSGASDFVDLL